MSKYENITEIIKDLKTFLDTTQKGKEATYKHYDIMDAINEWLHNNVNTKIFACNMRGYSNTLDVAYIDYNYNDYKLFYIDLKRKKFDIYKAYYEAQYYYSDFILTQYKDIENNLNKRINNARRQEKERQQREQLQREQLQANGKKALKMIIEAFNCSQFEARKICEEASKIYID